MNRADVVVAGGGLTGWSMALALLKEGHAVAVVEPRETTPPDRWGFVLWPPAVRVLEWLGLDIASKGVVLQAMTYLDGGTRPPIEVDLEEIAALGRFVGVRPSLAVTAIREEALSAGAVWCKAEVSNVDIDARQVTVHLSGARDAAPLVGRILVGCDGASSRVRRMLRLPSARVSVPYQRIFSGIGGPAKTMSVRQVFGSDWWLSVTPVSKEATWIAVCSHWRKPEDAAQELGAYDPCLVRAYRECPQLTQITPVARLAPLWEVDRALLIGDSAHAMLPHLGLGGTQSLEDVPVAAEVVSRALRTGDARRAQLAEFRRARIDRVRYAFRASFTWAAVAPGALLPVRLARSIQFGRMARDPQHLERLISHLAGTSVPDLWTRIAVGML